MYTDNNGVSYETQEDRYPPCPHSSDKEQEPERIEVCPKCGSREFQSVDGPLFVNDTRIEVCIQCDKCNHRWYEYYELVETIDGDKGNERRG